MEGKELITDRVLPNSFSSKAILQRIVLKGTPYVFKFQKELNDTSQRESVLRDVKFSELLKSKLGCSPAGAVVYLPFEFISNVGEVVGSISPVYVCSLNELKAPFPTTLLLYICSRVSNLLEHVHSIRWIIGDIKPYNLFLSSTGEIDVGDFGGAVEIGSSLIEYSDDYYPIDNFVASPTIDYICLIVTILELHQSLPSFKDVSDLDKIVRELPNLDIRDALIGILRKISILEEGESFKKLI